MSPDAAEGRNSPAAPHASTHDGGAQMPQESNDHTTILLQVLSSLRGDIGELRSEIADLNESASAIEVRQEGHHIELVEIKRRLDYMNGRGNHHEQRLMAIERRHERDDGEEAGRKAERDRMYAVARIASKPVTWAVGGVIGAVGYVIKDRAG